MDQYKNMNNKEWFHVVEDFNSLVKRILTKILITNLSISSLCKLSIKAKDKACILRMVSFSSIFNLWSKKWGGDDRARMPEPEKLVLCFLMASNPEGNASESVSESGSGPVIYKRCYASKNYLNLPLFYNWWF